MPSICWAVPPQLSMCTHKAPSCATGNEKIIAILQQQLVAQQESSAKVIEVLHQQLQQGSSKTFEVLHHELGQQRETDLMVSTCQSLGWCTRCSS